MSIKAMLAKASKKSSSVESGLTKSVQPLKSSEAGLTTASKKDTTKPSTVAPKVSKLPPKKKSNSGHNSEGCKVAYDGKKGFVVDDLATQYFVEWEDGGTDWFFKAEKELKFL